MLVWHGPISLGCALLLPFLRSLLHFGGSWRLNPCQSARAASPVLILLLFFHTIPSLLSSVLQTPPPCDLSTLHASVQSAGASKSFRPDIHRHTHCPTLIKSQATPVLPHLVSSLGTSNFQHSPLSQSFYSILIPSTLPPFSSSSQLLIKARMSCVFTNSFFHRAREVDRPPRRQRSARALSYRQSHSERRPAIAVAVRVNQRNCFTHRPTACLFVFMATGLHAAPTP